MQERKYNPAALRGLAKPRLVMSAWHDVFELAVPELADDLREITNRLLPVLETPDTMRIAVALACSIINTQYLEHGMECACDDQGRFGFTFEDNQDMRRLKYDGLINLDSYSDESDSEIDEVG
jgi:hypothetical protein